ncbi:hypothetical protein RHIZ_02875 [Rhizobium skierniewicense]|uniref:hypothetical protein n=1 Tax=Rhizobium skierniewicense TaxID=984260 RepID=UPI001FABBE29|nr:hypothetical protein [Rhizobium skierniewicense]MCI9864884.1 hypothetical protein [Rhizobium skierniewicense]
MAKTTRTKTTAAKLPAENIEKSQEGAPEDATGSTGSSDANTGEADNTVSDLGQTQPVDAHDQTGMVSAAASVSLSDTSQVDADGAGANASSVEQQTAMDNIFSATGAATLAELISLCALGRNVILAIESVGEDDPTFQNWLSDENPCGIIGELVAENAALNNLLDSRTAITAEPEKRRFVVERDVRLDNVLLEAGDIPTLTRKQHADVVAADACTTRWEDGAEI